MKDFFSVLGQNPLFENVDEKGLASLLHCVNPRYKKYKKDTFIFMETEEIKSIGIVLSGAVHIIRDDYWGNRMIISQVGAGDLFGEVFVCADVKNIPVSAVAVENTEISFFDFNRIITTCPSACVVHTMLIKNMISVLARKSMELMAKIECITQHTTREKVLFYLSSIAIQQKTGAASSGAIPSGIITIPFNRQELADYLSVERSALSAELCRMRNEGLIDFYKNQFKFLRNAYSQQAAAL